MPNHESLSILSDSVILQIPNTIHILGSEIPLFTIIITIAIIVGGFGIARFAKMLVTNYLGNQLPHDTRRTVSNGIYYGIIAIALLSAIGNSGADLSGVFLAGGIAGIVIGFATQSLFSNVISGIFLQIDKPMKVGDPVMLTGKLPEVAGIFLGTTPLSTRLRLFDGTYVRLPNTEAFSSEIRNFSGAAARRVELAIGIAYHENMAKAISVIKRTLAEIPLVLVEPEPTIYVDTLGDSSVNLNVWCWVPFAHWFPMKTELVQQIKKALDDKGIEIPFPQRVIHLADRAEIEDGKKLKDLQMMREGEKERKVEATKVEPGTQPD